MSTGKLDQSLDEIMKDSKSTRARPSRRQPRRAGVAKAKAVTTAAPVGGVKKNKKDNKPTTVVPAAVVPKTGESKIIVSGLPDDVNEMQIKDYFGKTIGPVKRVQLQYGPNGRSRGSANITFNKADSAAKAAKDLHGIKVDNRQMKIEVIMGANSVAAPALAKTLSERVSQPKNAAKEKTKATTTNAKKGTTNGAEKSKTNKKSGRAGRPKAKTSQELDQEMQDYFGTNEGANGAAAATNGAAVNGAVPAGGADAGMEDEVL